MKSFARITAFLLAIAGLTSAHCMLIFSVYMSLFSALIFFVDVFPSLDVNGAVTPAWVNVRRTNNYNSRQPVTDVTSMDLRCYDSQESGTAQTVTVSAGQEIGIVADQAVYHQSTSMYCSLATLTIIDRMISIWLTFLHSEYLHGKHVYLKGLGL